MSISLPLARIYASSVRITRTFCLYDLCVLGSLGPQSLPQLPCVHFAVAVPQDPSADDLYQRYRYLYENAVKACRAYAEQHPDDKVMFNSDDKNSALISYNLAMTTSSIAILPRRREGALLRTFEDSAGKFVGPIALNGTILAGTLMVKTEEEYYELRRNESSLYDLLQAIGIPTECNHSNVIGKR